MLPGVDKLWQLWYNIAIDENHEKERTIMLLTMLALLAAVPFTGDNFPAKTLIIIAVVAVIVLVTAFLLKKKDGDE